MSTPHHAWKHEKCRKNRHRLSYCRSNWGVSWLFSLLPIAVQCFCLRFSMCLMFLQNDLTNFLSHFIFENASSHFIPFLDDLFSSTKNKNMFKTNDLIMTLHFEQVAAAAAICVFYGGGGGMSLTNATAVTVSIARNMILAYNKCQWTSLFLCFFVHALILCWLRFFLCLQFFRSSILSFISLIHSFILSLGVFHVWFT